MKRILLLLILGIGMGLTGWGQVGMTTTGSHTQNFNGLNSSGGPYSWTDNTTIINWYSQRTGTGTTYTVDAGTGTAGTLYSYGSVSNSDRALGTIGSSNAAAGSFAHGVLLRNTSGTAITDIKISYTLEQWRKGGATVAQDITFWYKISSASFSALNPNSNGTWTQVTGLTLSSPINTATAAALDGNAAANRVTATNVAIPTLSLANNDYIMLKWDDPDHSGTDHGLSIDDVTINWTVVSGSSSSDIIANTSFSYPTDIEYGSYQGTTPLTTGNSKEVAQFDIQDGGGSADADALSTILTAISFNVANPGSLRHIALFDGSINLSEVAGGATASFSSLEITADDNGSKTFSVRVSFLLSVTDNEQFSFTVSSATASGSGSGFAAGNAGGAATSTTGDNNRIEVMTSDIIFDQNVSTVSLGAVMSPSPTLRAWDNNSNFDLDYIAGWSVAVTTGTAIFDGLATVSGSFSSGVATLSNLKFRTSGTGNKITVTSDPFIDESSTFDVTELSAEPSNHPSSFTAAANSQTQIDLAFSAASTITNAAGYIILQRTGSAPTGAPADATSYSVGNTIGDGTVAAIITSTSATSTSITSLAAGTHYYFLIFPYNWDGANAATYNYKTDGSVPGTDATTDSPNSSASDIIANGSFTYPTDILYKDYQETTITTASPEVAQFTIRDGGATADADNKSTTLTAISFSLSNSANLRKVALFNGSTNVAEVAAAATVSFSSLSLAATDGSTKDFSLRVSFQSTVTDNTQFQFVVTSATADATGSTFAAGNAGGAQTSTTGDNNRIEVTATKLVFSTAPSTTACPNTNLATPPVVSAKDANNNTDLDFTGQVTLTNSGGLGMTGYQVNPAISGVANFANLQFSETGNVTLSTTNTSGLTNDGPTASIAISVSDVTSAGATNGNTQSVVSWTNPSCYDEIMIVAKAGSAVTASPSGDGSAYAGNLTFGSGTTFDGGNVVYEGSSSPQTVTGLTNGTTYHFTFFTRKGSLWSSGVTTTATPEAVTLATDYFRSKASGNWNVAGTWESSPDGNIWINSTLTPNNTANTITLVNSFTVTVTANVTIDQVIVQSGGILSHTGGTITVANGTDDDIIVNDGGIFNLAYASNSPSFNTSASAIINSGGTLRVSATGMTGNGAGVNLANFGYDNGSILEYAIAGAFSASGVTYFPNANASTIPIFRITSITSNTPGGGSPLVVNGIIEANSSFSWNGAGTKTFRNGIKGSGTMSQGTTGQWIISGSTAELGGAGALSLGTNGLVINNGSAVSVTSSKSITGGPVTINGSLTINSSAALTVTGTLTNNAGNSGLVINSDATGTGSLIHSSASVSGTMQRYILGYSAKASTGWHLLASPVGSFGIEGSAFEPGATDDFFGWSETTYTWMNYKQGNPTKMVPDTGYLVSYETTPGTPKAFTGTFNYADKTLTNLSLTPLKANGWHLLGNPFQSALQWTNTGWAKTGIGAGAKIMNSGGTYTDITVDGTDIIPANQGFFVQANLADNSITIPASQRTHSSIPFYKSEIPNFVSLRASDGAFYVETSIQIMDDATLAFDEQYDVNFLGGVYQAPYLYSKLTETQRLSTNRIAPVAEETIIQLGFKSFLDKQFTITATNAQSFGDNIDVILQDSQTGIQVDLKKTPEYTFAATAGLLTERFKIHLLKTTGIHENNQAPAIIIYANGSQIYFNAPTATNALVSVYNITGQQVYSRQTMLQGLTPITLNAPTGWYVVNVVTADSSVSRKVFIK